jgi:hypothetical protein
MAVTYFPAATLYTFGSTSETGISVETYEQNDQTDVYEQKNNVGEVIEVVTFNPRSEITCTGEVTSALAAILGKEYTFTNLITSQYGTGTLTGISIVRGVQFGRNRARNMTARLTATFYPLVTA